MRENVIFKNLKIITAMRRKRTSKSAIFIFKMIIDSTEMRGKKKQLLP